MYSVKNREVTEAMRLFETHEKIDICPAAGVAVGSLLQAVKDKKVKKDDYIALNITGGGEKRLKTENNLHYLEPMLTVTEKEIRSEHIEKKLESIFVAV
jgi:cysteate synthase